MPLKVNWSHTTEGKQHSFIIEEVARKDKPSMVKLGFSGESLGVEQSEDREVEIPALGDFKVTNIRVDQSTAQHVVVQFSDPLNETQNLEGLVAISDLEDLDFEVKENEIHVYPPVRQSGSKTLTVEAGVLNILNYRMSQAASFDIAFEQLMPAVRFTTKGNVLPSSEGLVLPFEAVNLKAVDVKIIQIYENNILQFLQVNALSGNEELRRVGKPVLQTK
jgi:alpha-2-macroglobulin